MKHKNNNYRKKLSKLKIFGKDNCLHLGKFVKGREGSGFVCEFKKGSKTFTMHSRTKSGIRKIMNYYYSKGWKDSLGV